MADKNLEAQTIRELKDKIARLEKVNKVLIQKVEKQLENQHGSFSLFETNALLKNELETKSQNLSNAFKELQQKQAQLWQSAKLSSLGEMAAGIAHEINNPLSILLGYNHFLELKIKEKKFDKEGALELLAKNNETVMRISKIVKGLRSVSREPDPNERSLTSLKEAVEIALDLSSEKLKASGFEIKYHPGNKAFSSKIYFNEVQVAQALINLLNNSFDAVSENKQPWIEIGAEVKNKKVRLLVTDSGHGIVKEVRDKLFQPFFTTKDVGKGTGLGLSVSKGLIEQQGGTIFVNPKHKNTQFVIELPLAKDRDDLN